MRDMLLYVNMITGVLIVVLILVQGKGAGLGSAWGGSGEGFQTRRGMEKWVLKLTVALIIVFFIVSVANLLL